MTLYLLDEILHGTNSHERLAGASAVIRALVDRGAIGLVTTHDLSLAKIGDELSPTAVNVHFEDVIEEDRLTFDYKLRPGVVPRGNAVALMRLVGLPV
jgi:DNA mismatch repair ATPase MutS